MNEYADAHGTGADDNGMTSHLLERVQQKYHAVKGIGILNKNISMDQREKACKHKAQDANLQITAEMLGARASVKQAKVGVNSKQQKLAQASDADGSGDADANACSYDVNPSSSPAEASISAAANAPAEATAAAAVTPNRSDGGSTSGGGLGGGAVSGGHPGSDSNGDSSTAQAVS